MYVSTTLKKAIYDFKNSFSPDFLFIQQTKYVFFRNVFCWRTFKRFQLILPSSMSKSKIFLNTYSKVYSGQTHVAPGWIQNQGRKNFWNRTVFYLITFFVVVASHYPKKVVVMVLDLTIFQPFEIIWNNFAYVFSSKVSGNVWTRKKYLIDIFLYRNKNNTRRILQRSIVYSK